MSGDSFTHDKLKWLDQVADDLDLPPRAFLLAHRIGRYLSREHGEAWPGQNRLAEEIGVSIKAVRALIAALTERGHLEVEAGIGRGATSRYRPILKPADGSAPEKKGKLASPIPDAEKGKFRDRKGEVYFPKKGKPASPKHYEGTTSRDTLRDIPPLSPKMTFSRKIVARRNFQLRRTNLALRRDLRPIGATAGLAPRRLMRRAPMVARGTASTSSGGTIRGVWRRARRGGRGAAPSARPIRARSSWARCATPPSAPTKMTVSRSTRPHGSTASAGTTIRHHRRTSCHSGRQRWPAKPGQRAGFRRNPDPAASRGRRGPGRGALSMEGHITAAAQGATAVPTSASAAGRIGRVLGPACAPYLIARRIVASEVAKAILPPTLDQPCRTPDHDLGEMQTVLAALPAEAELRAARDRIADALAQRATYEQIVAIVAAAVDTRTAVSAERRGQIAEGVAWHLEVECSLKHVSPYVLAGAMLRLTRESRFFPDVPEILAQLDRTATFMALAVLKIGLLIEARRELEESIETWCRVEAQDPERQAKIARGEPVPEDWALL